MNKRDRFEEDYAAALQAVETRHGGGEIDSTDSADSTPPWWLAFLYLFRHIGSQFAKHFAVLKKMRRSRPMPKDWRAFYPRLREAEWPIHVLLTEGARQLLAGQPLDLHAVPFDPDPPSTFQPSMPRSALAMHQRIEATARFNANPELYVCRHAARIRAREALRLEARLELRLEQEVETVPVAVPIVVPVFVPVAGRHAAAGLRVRVPP